MRRGAQMDRIEMFVENLFKRSPKTLEVSSQKIEIVADLREKISGEINKGKSFEEAFESATASYRDMEELSVALDKSVRSIFINRFSCHLAWLSAAIGVLFMFISFTVFLKLNPDIYVSIAKLVSDPFSDPDYLGAIIGGTIGMFGALTGIFLYPIKCIFVFRKKPNEVQRIGFNLKTQLIWPFLCWLLISVVLTAGNLYVYYNFDFDVLVYPLIVVFLATGPIDALLFRYMYCLPGYKADAM